MASKRSSQPRAASILTETVGTDDEFRSVPSPKLLRPLEVGPPFDRGSDGSEVPLGRCSSDAPKHVQSGCSDRNSGSSRIPAAAPTAVLLVSSSAHPSPRVVDHHLEVGDSAEAKRLLRHIIEKWQVMNFFRGGRTMPHYTRKHTSDK